MKLLVVVVILLFVGLIKAQTWQIEEHFGVPHQWQPVTFANSSTNVQVEFPYNGSVSGMRMIGPNGQEVPFQKLSTDMILIRARLAGSSVSRIWISSSNINPGNDAWTCNSVLCPRNGEIAQVRITSNTGSIPAGLSESTNYFLGVTSGGYWQFYTTKARTTPLTWSVFPTGNVVVVSNGWIVDPDDATFDTLYSLAHSFQTGDPLTIRCIYGNVLPNPVVCNGAYFAINTGTNNLKLASSYSNAMNGVAIDIMESSVGISTVSELFVNWTWSLQSGTPTTAPANPVVLQDKGTYWEMTNGLTGARVLKPNSATKTKIGLNGILMADGVTWTAQDVPFTGNISSIISVTGNIVENGPLKTTFQMTWSIDRALQNYGAWKNILEVNVNDNTIVVPGNLYWKDATTVTFKGASLPCPLQPNKYYWATSWQYLPDRDATIFTFTDSRLGPTIDITCAGSGSQVLETPSLAGTGSFTQTVSLFAGHRIVMIEDDTDTRLTYNLDFYKTGTFEPDLLRYRGHSSSNVICGYQFAADGVTKVAAAGYTSDSLIDLQYTTARTSSYLCSSTTFPGAMNWYPAASAQNAGWYYMMYKNGAASNYPMMGMFIGRTSRSLGLVWNTPTPFTNTGPNAGFAFSFDYRGPSGASTQRARKEYAIFVGTNADVPNNMTFLPPIALERNMISGIGLSRLVSYNLSIPDPPAGWNSYKGINWTQTIVDVRNPDGIFYNYSVTVSPETKDMMDFWRSNNSISVDSMLSPVLQAAHLWADILVRQLGNYDAWWQYYQPDFYLAAGIPRFIAAYQSGSMTPSQKSRWGAIHAWYAAVMWDEDYAALSTDNRENPGNFNQWLMHVNMRAEAAYTLSSSSNMGALKSSLLQEAATKTYSYINEYGAPAGSTWYYEPGIEPGLAAFLNFKNEGGNLAVTFPRLSKFGRWMLQTMTPIEPRFGIYRKMVSLGDGNTYSSCIPGLLASLLRESDPQMSKYVQWAWSAQGSIFHQFTIPSFLVTDRTAESIKPYLTSEYFPGYMSVLRHNFDTPQETVAWFINGDFFTDHRHNDQGQVTIYAHGAPLSIDWNPNLYYPEVNGGFQHNRVIQESLLGHAWDIDNPPLGSNVQYWPTMASSFANFTYSTTSKASYGNNANDTWVRQVNMVVAIPQFPIILVRDEFYGIYATTPRVLTWNFMAVNNVSTPNGTYAPILRMYPQKPSNGSIADLAVGLNKFQFTGETWKAHPKGGINWDYYYLSNSIDQFYIGNWAHYEHTNAEKLLFLATNNVTFYERQHILRIRSSAAMISMIIPYEKGTTFSSAVTSTSCGISIGTEITCLSENGYSFQNGSLRIYTAFGSVSQVFNSDTFIVGGAAEIVFTSSTQGVITISGVKSTRTFIIPNGPWYGPGLSANGDNYTIFYNQDSPLVLAISKSSAPSPTPSNSMTPSPSPSVSPSPSNTPSVTPSNTPSVSPTRSVTPSVSPTRSPSNSVTPSRTPSPTNSPSPSVTPTNSPSPSMTPTNTPSVTPTNSPSPSMSPTNSPSMTPTNSPSTSVTPSRTPSPSVTPTNSPSVTPTRTTTPSLTSSPTASPSLGASASVTPTRTPSSSVSSSVTPSVTPTPTPSPTSSPSATPSPSISPTPSVTPSASSTPSSSASSTPSSTPSITPSISTSVTPSSEPSISPSTTPSISVSPSRTPGTRSTPTKTPSSPSASPSPVQCPPPNTIICEDICVASVAECVAIHNECPTDQPFKCSDDTCVASITECGGSICEDGQLCWDGSCAPTQRDCPPVDACPPGTYRCAASCEPEPCSADSVSCDVPLCSDGSCPEGNTCPNFNGCPIHSVMCPDGRCVANSTLCMCSASEYLCFDGTCSEDCLPAPATVKPFPYATYVPPGESSTVTVVATDGSAIGEIYITPSGPATISISSVPDSVIMDIIKSYTLYTPVVSLSVDGIPSSNFDTPVKICLTFTLPDQQQDLPANTCLAFINSDNEFECTSDTHIEGNLLCGTTTHFSEFGAGNFKTTVHSASSGDSKDTAFWVWIIVAVGGVIVLGVIVLIVIVIVRKKKEKEQSADMFKSVEMLSYKYNSN